MRIGLSILCAALLLSGCAGRPGTATVYKPANIFGGYKDEMVGPAMWKIEARSNGIAERGFASNMAAYRAAELAKQAGFSHFEIIDQEGKTTMVGYGAPTNFAGENLMLLIRGKSDALPPSECRAKDQTACFTAAVDEIIRQVEPMLTFPKGDPRNPVNLEK